MSTQPVPGLTRECRRASIVVHYACEEYSDIVLDAHLHLLDLGFCLPCPLEGQGSLPLCTLSKRLELLDLRTVVPGRVGLCVGWVSVCCVCINERTNSQAMAI